MREEDDRQPAGASIGLDTPADLEPIHIRQVGMDQGHVVRALGGLVQSLIAARDGDHLETALRTDRPQPTADCCSLSCATSRMRAIATLARSGRTQT
jgi:hypothetical protein